MGIRARPNSTSEAEDDGDTDTIPAMISKLKMSFRSADYARAERALLARESNLKREIEKLRNENAKLLEASQFIELEMLRVATESKGVILEQGRRIKELERQKLKLEGLVMSEYEGWKGLVSQLEADAGKLKGETEMSGAVEVKLEFGVKDSENVVRVPKRRPTSSLSGSDDDDKGGGKFKEDLNNEMKQRQKLSLESDSPRINNHCTGKLEFSGIKVSENQNLLNHEQVNSRVSEGKIMADQKSQLSLNTPVEVSSDSDSDSGQSGANSSSSCSSTSSDSEDENLLLSQLDDVLPKAKAREGSCSV